MIEIFNSQLFIKVLEKWYKNFWKTKITDINWTNIIFLKIKNIFTEAVIPFAKIKTDEEFEELIKEIKKHRPFRIRLLFYNRLFLSENIAEKYWLEKQYTQIINLQQTLEDIFKNFRPTYRNEINKYLKWKWQNLVVKKTTSIWEELNNFYSLYKNTILRVKKHWAKHLVIESKDYFEYLMNNLNWNAIVYNLYFEWNLINSALILKDINWIYYLKWASNNKKKYRKIGWWRILHYEIVKDNIWNWIYDLWWINWEDLNDPITKFKIWFWWRTISFYWWEIILNKKINYIFKWLEKIYNLIKK